MSQRPQSMSDMYDSSRVWNDLRLQGALCDAVIRVEDVSFKIHRVIMGVCSPYCLNAFRHPSPPDQRVFDIPGVSPAIMELIIEFAYTESVSVTEGNVRELLLAAIQLQVADVVRTCSDFLTEKLSPTNCIGLFQFPSISFPAQLRQRAYRCILDHFMEVVLSEEFPQLSVQHLSDILDSDYLNVNEERTAYEAVLRWIAHGPEERKAHITALLSKVRLGLTGVDFLMNTVMKNELVMNDPECLQLITETAEIMSNMVTNRPSEYHPCTPSSRPRFPNAVMLAIGGWMRSDPTNSIEAYDVRADNWINVTIPEERPRAYHGTAFLNGSVYCVGGFDRVEQFNSVRRFNLITHTWHEAAPMCHRRCYVSVVVLGGCIYAMGGYDGYARLCTAERYRPEANQWSLIAPMQWHRSDASSTTLHNMIYICGGFNGNECLQTCECYRPETNQWTMICPMSCRRSGIGIIAYADRVYAVGGFDGSNRLCTAEAYDPRTNTWLPVKPMMTPRSNFGIAVLEDQLFVVGGFNGLATSCNVERYDAAIDAWAIACHMDVFRSALSCCVVSPVPNVEEYVVSRDTLQGLHLDDVCVESGDSD